MDHIDLLNKWEEEGMTEPESHDAQDHMQNFHRGIFNNLPESG